MRLISSSISFDEYGYKIRKVSRFRPTASNKTILATTQEVFFTKVTPVQSITEIVLLDFWLMLLSWMLILSLTNIYFFYISVNTIFECLYIFLGWERSHQFSTYETGVKMGRSLSSELGERVSRFMCMYALTRSLFMFLAAFLSYSVLFYLVEV